MYANKMRTAIDNTKKIRYNYTVIVCQKFVTLQFLLTIGEKI